jgi:hypothetical protein
LYSLAVDTAKHQVTNEGKRANINPYHVTNINIKVSFVKGNWLMYFLVVFKSLAKSLSPTDVGQQLCHVYSCFALVLL